MKKFEIEFSENNSGGWYALDRDDYAKLQAAGWVADYTYLNLDDNPRYLTRTILADNEDGAYEQAISEWEFITGEWRDLCVCQCCGDNFYFSINEVEYSAEEAFTEAVKEAFESEQLTHTECESILDRVFYGIELEHGG